MRQRIVRTRCVRLLTHRYQLQLDSAILLTPVGGSIARDEVRGTESARNQAVGGDTLMFEIGRDCGGAISGEAKVHILATSWITVRIDIDLGIGMALQGISRRIKNRIGSAADYRTIRIELQSV